MTADVSRTTNYQDDHVASFPWEWLARIFASEIGFRTAGVGLYKRGGHIQCTFANETKISQDGFGPWEGNGRKNHFSHCSRRTTRKLSHLRGDRPNLCHRRPS